MPAWRPLCSSLFSLLPSLCETGLTGLEPATSGVTDRHSNQAELQPPELLATRMRCPTPVHGPNGSRTRLCTLKECRPNR
jgi:hypothetical protein